MDNVLTYKLPEQEPLQGYEKRELVQLMRREQGNATKIAQAIGIGRSTLYNAIKPKTDPNYIEPDYKTVDRIRRFLELQKKSA